MDLAESSSLRFLNKDVLTGVLSAVKTCMPNPLKTEERSNVLDEYKHVSIYNKSYVFVCLNYLKKFCLLQLDFTTESKNVSLSINSFLEQFVKVNIWSAKKAVSGLGSVVKW